MQQLIMYASSCGFGSWMQEEYLDVSALDFGDCSRIQNN